LREGIFVQRYCLSELCSNQLRCSHCCIHTLRSDNIFRRYLRVGSNDGYLSIQ
jgi:hypothetical protein